MTSVERKAMLLRKLAELERNYGRTLEFMSFYDVQALYSFRL
jgi:hypothetical protein